MSPWCRPGDSCALSSKGYADHHHPCPKSWDEYITFYSLLTYLYTVIISKIIPSLANIEECYHLNFKNSKGIKGRRQLWQMLKQVCKLSDPSMRHRKQWIFGLFRQPFKWRWEWRRGQKPSEGRGIHADVITLARVGIAHGHCGKGYLLEGS